MDKEEMGKTEKGREKAREGEGARERGSNTSVNPQGGTQGSIGCSPARRQYN